MSTHDAWVLLSLKRFSSCGSLNGLRMAKKKEEEASEHLLGLENQDDSLIAVIAVVTVAVVIDLIK